MAIITPGALISEITGSVGAETFARNQWRAYVKARVTPTNPNTSYQGGIRAHMQTSVLAWQELDDGSRAEWEAGAKFWHSRYTLDGVKPLNGFTYFMRNYLTYSTHGAGDAGEIHPPRFLAGASITAITLNSTTFDIEVTPKGSNVNDFYVLRFSDVRSAGRSKINPSLLKPIQVGANSDGVFVYDLKAAWESRFASTLAAHIGEKIFVSLQILDGKSQYLSPLQIQFSSI